MPHKLFRDRVITMINTAINDARDAADMDHAGLRGRIREIALNTLLQPLLPGGFSVGTGKIIDHTGAMSPEIDLVIYSKDVLPPIMYSERDGVFPVEACFYAIEVKSKATVDEIRDAIYKAERLQTLQYLSGTYDSKGAAITHHIDKVVPVFFAFETNLNNKSELDRYFENDPNGKTAPCIPVICVPERGYWYFHWYDQRWVFYPPAPERDEVIDFLSGVVNTLPDSRFKRSRPRIGNYLMGQGRVEYVK